MSESSALYIVVEGIVMFDGRREFCEDWKEQVFLNISKGQGCDNPEKILKG